MPVVDTLTTRFVYDATGAEKGARDVLGATSKIGKGINDAVGSITRLTAGAAIAGGAGLLAFGKKALESAVSFSTLTGSLTAVTKSAERAKEILRFDDKLAAPSIFESKDLAAASLSLEAFRLKTERFLPIAEKLGTVFGGTTESLKEYVTALGYIKSGRFGEGFESLSRAGLSRDDFRAKGLQFDKGGAYKGEADQALNAIEQLVNERFGGLSDQLAKGPAAKLASVGDLSSIIFRKAGDAILKVYLPAIDAVSDKLQKLVSGGTVERIANSFAALFSGKDIGQFAAKGIDAIVEGLAKLPAWIEKNRDTFKSIASSATSIGKALSGLAAPALENLLSTADRLLKVFTALPQPIQSMVLTLGLVNKATGGLVGTAASAIGGIKTGTGDTSGTLGGLLMKTITGPIGLIGSVLIAGAVGLADAASKGIDVLEGRKADKASVARSIRVLDENGREKFGKNSLHDLTEDEKDWFYKELRRVRKTRELGVLDEDDDGTMDPNTLVAKRLQKKLYPQKKINSTTTQGEGGTGVSPGETPVYQSVLERIAIASEKQLEVKTQLSGGSTLASNVTSDYGLRRTDRGGGRSPIHAAAMQFADIVAAQVSSHDPVHQRVRMAR